MNYTKNLISVASAGLVVLLSGVTTRAQENVTTANESSSLLGKRYVEAGFAFVDVNHTHTDAYGSGLDVNVPVTANIDVNLAYTYSWVEGNSNLHGNLVDAAVTTYFASGNLKPFGSLSLGYDWVRNFDRSVWGVEGGLEYDLNPTWSFTGSVAYDDDFKKGDNSSWTGTGAAHYWVTKDVAITGSIGWIEGGDVAYAISALWKF